MLKNLAVGFNDSIYDKAIRDALPGDAPIFYCDAEYILTTGRKKELKTVKKLVLKGSLADINKTQKIRVALASLKDQSDYKKKAIVFDLDRIEVKSLNVIRLLGYGPIEKM